MGTKNEKIFILNNNEKLDLIQPIKSSTVRKTNINNYKMIYLKKSIKSKYILMQILNILEESRLLKIIRHNKEYQTFLEVNLENYKKLSGKIKIMGFNGYGKEYDSGSMKLLFEGEYLNGLRNGKGKEYYYNGKLKYEGNYLNGQINGKGKEYNDNGKLVFEGEYLKGQKSKGKEYDVVPEIGFINIKNNIEINENYIAFEGEYLNDKKWNGILKEYFNNFDFELSFEGNYKNGDKNGECIEYYDNGKIIFKGEYLNGNRWNGIIYNIGKNENYKIENGNGKVKEYDYYGRLLFDGDYLN